MNEGAAGARAAATSPGPSAPQLFDGLDAGFRAARERFPQICITWHLRLGGLPVCVETVGERVAQHVGSALAHLASTDDASVAPALTVQLWDVDETGIEAPARLERHPDGEEELIRAPDDSLIVEKRGQSLVALRRDPARIVGCMAYGGHPPLLHEIGKPLQQLFAVWMGDRDIPLMHVAMVAREGRGVLIGGAGGAGKSTTSLACLLGGFDFLGDDRVGLQLADGRYMGHSIFSSTMLFASQFERFPRLAADAVGPSHPRDRKPVVFLARSHGERLARSAVVSAVALPRLADSEATRFRRATGGQALLAIAPSSLILPLGPGARGMRRMADVVRTVPCYWLDLGRDLAAIPDAIQSLLQDAERCA